MTQSNRKRSWVRLVWVVAIAAAVVGTTWLAIGVLADDGSTSARPDAGPNAAIPQEAVSTAAGPERLREGAVQILDPASGLATARESWERVEAELAKAEDPDETARLERKREMIRHAIDRLAPAGPP